MSDTPFDTELAPKPWSLVTRISGSENHRGYYIIDANGRRVAEVMPLDADGHIGWRVGLGLLAAPDYYDAVEAIATYFDGSHLDTDEKWFVDSELLIRLFAAHAKAEGRTP